MEINFAAEIDRKFSGLDPISTLKLAADLSGMAHFPLKRKTMVDPLLTGHLLREPAVQGHWMHRYGLGVSAVINPGSGTFLLMRMQSATGSEYENAFDEALADPLWVAAHARIALEAMRAEARDAAVLMEIAWETAMEIPQTRQRERWAATTRHALMY